MSGEHSSHSHRLRFLSQFQGTQHFWRRFPLWDEMAGSRHFRYIPRKALPFGPVNEDAPLAEPGDCHLEPVWTLFSAGVSAWEMIGIFHCGVNGRKHGEQSWKCLSLMAVEHRTAAYCLSTSIPFLNNKLLSHAFRYCNRTSTSTYH